MITEPEWTSIAAAIEQGAMQVSGRRRDHLVMGRVVKRDATNKLIWLNEFGDQPIPIITFDYEVKYYDTEPSGRVAAKLAIVSVATPKVGETVLVVREMGMAHLPRCLGVVKSKKWITEND